VSHASEPRKYHYNTLWRYFLTPPAWLATKKSHYSAHIYRYCVRKYTAGALYRDYFLWVSTLLSWPWNSRCDLIANPGVLTRQVTVRYMYFSAGPCPPVPVDWLPFLWIDFHSSGLISIPVDWLPFLWIDLLFLWIDFHSSGLTSIPVDSCLTPVESTGIDLFLQESVGHQKVLCSKTWMCRFGSW